MRSSKWSCVLAICLGVSAGSAKAAVTQDTFLLRNTGDLMDLCSAAQSDPLYTAAVHFCHGFTVGVFRVLQEEDMAKQSRHMFCLPSPTAEPQRGHREFRPMGKGRSRPIRPAARRCHRDFPCPAIPLPARPLGN